MSEQAATPSSTPATPVSPATELAPNTVLHEAPPVAPVAPVAPEIPQDYRVNTLENGQREVILNSGQVYKGDVEHVINELAKAQYHASRTITDLKGQIPAAPPAPIETSSIDPTAKALADLTAQGMGFRNAEDYVSQLNQVRDFTQQQQLNQVAANFIATTPDYPVSPENADKIDATLAAFGLPATPDALKMVHNHLKATGQYVQVPQSQQVQRSPAMPMPPNGVQPPQTGQMTEQDIWAMDDKQFAAFEQRLRSR